MTRETPVEQGFHCFRVFGFWLLQGQRDRYAEEFESSALGRSGFGEGGHGGAGVVVSVAEVDPGQTSQVVQQGGEAGGGSSSVVVLVAALASAAWERWAGATGSAASGLFSSVNVKGAQAWRRCHTR